jgi:hypothetical protein
VDSFTTALSARPEFADLVVLVVLRQGSKERLAKMVAERRLPVLEDIPEVDFQRTFGVSGARAFFFFDRKGCMVEFENAVAPEKPGQLDQLLDPLRRAAG